MTPTAIMGVLLMLGIVALPVGISILVQSNALYEKTIKYGGSGNSDIDCSSGTCTATFSITKDIDDDLYLYYELTNYFQNNIKYVASIPWDQLTGDVSQTESELETICTSSATTNGTASDGTDILLNPCGLVAKSFFTDKYSMDTSASTVNGATPSAVTLDETDLVWTSSELFAQPDGFEYAEVDSCSDTCASVFLNTDCSCYTDSANSKYYLYYYPSDDKTTYLWEMYPGHISPIDGVKDEHFKVWMNVAALPDFRKPYATISGPFKDGDVVSIDIESVYDVKGTKSLVLTERYSLGLPNTGVGVTYIVSGSCCLAFAILFLIKEKLFPRPLGSPAELNWKS
jgi:hypothetical protein